MVKRGLMQHGEAFGHSVACTKCLMNDSPKMSLLLLLLFTELPHTSETHTKAENVQELQF